MKLLINTYNYNVKAKILKEYRNIMKPIIIKSNLITKVLSVYIDVCAITLYPFIVINEACDHPVIMNHEKIHLKQQRELWIIPFYALYVWYWLKGRMQGMDNHDAYMSIPFEKEAYEHQYDFKYIENRKPGSWKSYINLT